MQQSRYLHVHIPGRGRITLSLPDGVERAIISGRLPADAEVWHDGMELWIPIKRHPEIARLLDLAALSVSDRPTLPQTRPEEPEPAEPPLRHVPPPDADPAQLPLISLEANETEQEFKRFLQGSSAVEERRRVSRASGGQRTTGPGRIFVAGALELRRNQRRLRRLMMRYSIPGWAAALVILVLGSGAIGLYFLGRATGTGDLPVPVTVTNALSAAWSDHPDSSGLAALAEPNPLALEEQDLERNLRIAEAVIWQPAIDFSSPDQISRSSRKVDAVRNSISLYRIGAWRSTDSTERDRDPRLEPYEEATRVDEILRAIQSAVAVLQSGVGQFAVNGETLVFSNGDLAERYIGLRLRGDSLLRIAVPNDSVSRPRPPRRVVTRLLETLPPAIVSGDAP